MLGPPKWNSNAILFNAQKWWPVDPACSPDERCNDSFFLYGEREWKGGEEARRGGSRFAEIYEKSVVFIKSFVETPDRVLVKTLRASETIL